jgi:hypothetical protein
MSLAAGRPIREAAEQAGISERTAHRAMKSARFLNRVRAIQADMRKSIVGQLTGACTEAVETLQALLGDKHPATARLGAARAILEHSARLTETVELERRIAELEAGKLNDAPEFATAN